MIPCVRFLKAIRGSAHPVLTLHFRKMAIEERHNLTSRAIQIRLESRCAGSLRNASLRCPKNGTVVIIAADNIRERIRSSSRSGVSSITAQESHNLRPTASDVRLKRSRRRAVGNSAFQCPQNGVIILLIGAYISKGIGSGNRGRRASRTP